MKVFLLSYGDEINFEEFTSHGQRPPSLKFMLIFKIFGYLKNVQIVNFVMIFSFEHKNL